MCAHAEPVRDRFKILLLFVDALLLTPPPGLVHERAVSGIHEADDAVIDADRHFGLQIGEFVLAAEFFDLWSFVSRLGWRRESSAGGSWIGHEYPDEVVLLFAVIASGVNAFHFQLLVGSQ